ncbi:hypothetical protein GAY28_34175 [Azospirillum brasilense]|nr:hypothetical protein [Azospirillum brasilense]
MPYDFRSQDQRTADSGRTPGTPIGFHELRQACEISALREDLERVLQDTSALRDSIEDAVEQVGPVPYTHLRAPETVLQP